MVSARTGEVELAVVVVIEGCLIREASRVSERLDNTSSRKSLEQRRSPGISKCDYVKFSIIS